MAFPTSPTNGQTTTQNGQVYTWDAALGVWALTVGTTGDLSGSSVTATANISGGNILTAGIISSTGNVTGGNINTGGVISATGNIDGGNINTAGLISATGNIVGANIITGGALTAASYSATGNVTGGNIITAGVISAASISLSGVVVGAGNLTTGNISVTGNIGVGTSLPQAALDLGDGTGGKAITWGGPGGTARYSSIFSAYSSASLVAARGFTGNTLADSYVSTFTGTYGDAAIRLDSTGNIQMFTNAASAQTAGAAFVPTQRMIIDTGGNVGIANATPLYKLQVNNASASATGDAFTLQNTGVTTLGHTVGMRFRYITAEPAAIRAILTNTSTGTGDLAFYTSPDGTGASLTERARIDSTGMLVPGATATYDLGTASLRWRNVFTSDLHLNNGIGNYTIVEGEDDLFLYNNRNGKTYKFALTEVDPSTVPPKMKES